MATSKFGHFMHEIVKLFAREWNTSNTTLMIGMLEYIQVHLVITACRLDAMLTIRGKDCRRAYLILDCCAKVCKSIGLSKFTYYSHTVAVVKPQLSLILSDRAKLVNYQTIQKHHNLPNYTGQYEAVEPKFSVWPHNSVIYPNYELQNDPMACSCNTRHICTQV